MGLFELLPIIQVNPERLELSVFWSEELGGKVRLVAIATPGEISSGDWIYIISRNCTPRGIHKVLLPDQLFAKFRKGTPAGQGAVLETPDGLARVFTHREIGMEEVRGGGHMARCFKIVPG
jgi:hypothetical protein